MAVSGLIQGTLTQGSDHFRSYIYWQVVNSQEDKIAYNRSLVRLIPLIDTTDEGWTWDGNVSSLSNNINGEIKNNYGTFNSDSNSGWTYSASTSPTGRIAENIMSKLSTPYYEVYVYHNSDGTKSNVTLACSYSLSSGGYGPGNVSISGTASLDTIPRYATATNTVSNIKETTVNVSWVTDVAVDTVQYRLNGGSWITVESSVDKTSGTYTIEGLLPNTNYRIDFDYRRKDSQKWSHAAGYSNSVNITTLDYITYVNVNGSWKKAVPYINVNGSWKKAVPYINVNGSWKEGIN